MKTPRILIVFVAAGFLAACAQAQNNPKQTVGTVAGAGLGALLGSQIGSGKGQLAAVAIGAVAGGLLGSEIGKSMDDVDRQKAQLATQQALETAPSGTAVAWRNPDSGHYGQVTPQPAYQSNTGQTCREYQQEVTIGGKSETVVGTACRQADGSWRVVK
jgi:surface antigen